MARYLSDDERAKLLYGPYAAPKCRVGGSLYCVYRGRKCLIAGLADTPIPWPSARRTGSPSPIVCRDLARAVRHESVIAVMHHWGVSRKTVTKWRRALGVPRWNEGSWNLYQVTQPERYDPKKFARVRKLAQTPEAHAKRAATVKGRPLPVGLRLGPAASARTPRSAAFRRELSLRLRREWQSGQRHGHPPGRPWTDEEIGRLGTDTDAAIARELGRTMNGVRATRRRLGIPCFVPVV